jgi:hypothetical protein
MVKQITLAILTLFLLAAVGCDGPRTVWSAESRSPDGKMIAHAWTVQPSGIGTGNPGTFVDLNWRSGSQSPTLVLAFDDGSDSAEGDKKVGMNWLSSTHLNLTYTGPRTIDFQAIKCHGIDISVQDEKLIR